MFTMKDIFTVTPHLPFRFKVEFFGVMEDLKKAFEEATYFVKSVKLPVIESGSEDNTIFLGNGMITIPTFNPASRELEITFEETDIMAITRINDVFLLGNSCGWFRPIIIGITEYTQDMNTVLRRKAYHCRMKEYTEPQFSNSGGVNIITITVTFKVDSEIDWDGEEIKFEKDQLNRIEGLTKNIKDMKLQTMNITTVSAKSTYKEEALPSYSYANSDFIFDGGPAIPGARIVPKALKLSDKALSELTESQRRLYQIITHEQSFTKKSGTVRGNLGLMALKQIDLEDLYQIATKAGFNLTDFNQVQKFMVNYGMSTRSLSQCTRGIALTHQLYSYAMDKSKGVDRSNSHYYQSAPAAHLYNTNGSVYYRNAQGLYQNKDKFTSLKETLYGNNAMSSFMSSNLTKSGDYVTFQYGSSQHIVMLYIDEQGRKYWYSDFNQATAGGIASSTAAFKNIKVHKMA